MNIDLKWKRRFYQEPVWKYLCKGGKHVELIWHRRAGKDEIAGRFAAACMAQPKPYKAGNYWHMLPQANQVRIAIWKAINKHTGKRRIEEWFPKPLFAYNESEMRVTCVMNGSTWQCLGSDNYQGAIGSSVAGITFSEWALANPSARGYLRPILAENKGWQIFVTTPRGKNHAHSTYRAALKNDNAFAETLTVHDTGMLAPEELIVELEEYVATYGESMGIALYEQEYECSFEAAIMGAIYGSEMATMDREGRIRPVLHNSDYPVHVAMDIGRSDATAIWWFQCYDGGIYVIDFQVDAGHDPDYYLGALKGQDVQLDIVDSGIRITYGSPNEWAHRSEYAYGRIYLPHDARAQNFGTLKTAEEQFAAVFGWKTIRLCPQISREDGLKAVRQVMRKTHIDEDLDHGIEALKEYHYEWDDTKKMFRDIPFHNWASHPADGFRYLAVAYQEDRLSYTEQEKRPEEARYPQDRTFNEMRNVVKRRRLA